MQVKYDIILSVETYILHFDGSCGPKNPGGTAAYGYVLHHDGVEIDRDHAVVGTGPGMSNNVAEFAGLAAGLKACSRNVSDLEYESAEVNVFGDSQLVVNIMRGAWRAHNDKLYWAAYTDAKSWHNALVLDDVTVKYNWVPREQNTICDDLSKAHLGRTA